MQSCAVLLGCGIADAEKGRAFLKPITAAVGLVASTPQEEDAQNSA